MESRGALCVWHLLAWWAFVNLELEIIHISRRQSSKSSYSHQGHHMPRVATIGALPESDVLPFLLEYAKNDSRVPLPTTQPYKDDELRRRCARLGRARRVGRAPHVLP